MFYKFFPPKIVLFMRWRVKIR